MGSNIAFQCSSRRRPIPVLWITFYLYTVDKKRTHYDRKGRYRGKTKESRKTKESDGSTCLKAKMRKKRKLQGKKGKK